MDLLSTQAVLFVYLVVGIYVNKKGLITKENQSKLIDLVLIVFMPCMIVNSFQQEINKQVIQTAGIIIGMAFIVAIMAYLLGKVFYYKYPYGKRVIMQYGTIVNNSGFIGLPLAGELYGDIGLFYASFFLIPNRIFMWSVGISLFDKTEEKGRWKKVVFNPNIIAVGIGILRCILKIEFPYFIDYSLSKIGGIVSPLSMIIVGAIIADVDMKKIFDKSVFYISFIRLAILPVITMGLAKLFQLDSTVAGVALVLTAMPVGTTTALLAAKYNADVDFASKCVFVTTLLSLITVPILLMLL